MNMALKNIAAQTRISRTGNDSSSRSRRSNNLDQILGAVGPPTRQSKINDATADRAGSHVVEAAAGPTGPRCFDVRRRAAVSMASTVS